MRTWSLSRHNDEDLVFEGEHLLTMDDREWLGVTPNWWELSLYRTAHNEIVLGSVYFQNFPYRRTMRGALLLQSLDEVAQCLRDHCGAPDMIIDALLARARRSLARPMPTRTATPAHEQDMPMVHRPMTVSNPCLVPA